MSPSIDVLEERLRKVEADVIHHSAGFEWLRERITRHKQEEVERHEKLMSDLGHMSSKIEHATEKIMKAVNRIDFQDKVIRDHAAYHKRKEEREQSWFNRIWNFVVGISTPVILALLFYIIKSLR